MKLCCPAAAFEHGTLSLNVMDVRCGVAGTLRAAPGSPCCGEYAKCPIWRTEKERVWLSGHANRADAAIHSGTGTWEPR